MASEHVVLFTDEASGLQRHLDINNGYVYDLSGNQVGRMGVKDDSKSADLALMTARACANEVYGRDGIINGALQQGRRLQAALKNGSAEKEVAMSGGELGYADVHQAAPLTNYAAGFRQEAPIADMFAPPLLVSVQSGKFYTFSPDDAYQSATPIVGAPAGTVPEVSPRLSNDSFSCPEYAVGAFVSTQLDAAADAPLRIRVAAGKRAMNSLLIAREARVSKLATTSGSYDANNVVTLGAGFNWNGGANADPVADLHARIEASIMRPTGILMNPRIWHYFVRNPAVQKYFAYKSDVSPIPTTTQMSALLDLPPIYVGHMRQKNSSGVYDYLWPDDVVLVRQPERMPPIDQEDIATAITFRWNAINAPAGADVQQAAGGFMVREFYNAIRGSMGGSQVVVLMHDAEKMTTTFTGGLLLGVKA